MFFSKKNIRISIRDKKLVIETKSGVNLYRFLIQERMILPTLCDGSGQCGKCKIRFLGRDIPKPTYKETLILAKINIEAGYRLACQHTVKKDVEIDTSEMSSSVKFFNSDYPKAIKESPKAGPALHKTAVEPQSLEDKEPAGETDKINAEEEEDEGLSISEFKPMASKARPPESREDEGPSDGIFLIQQRSGVRYFCYSAALDNIVSEGSTETSEPLRDIIDNNLVSDFIHDALKIRDIDRVMILIEQNDSYRSESVLDMIKYFRFELGTLLCEVMMPYKKNHDIVRFFRLLNMDKGNIIIFSLDMLDRVHYSTDKLFTDMSFSGLVQDNITVVKARGKNPITAFNDDLTPRFVAKPGSDPDGVTLTALLQCVKLLYQKGIIDGNFQIRSRGELSRLGIPLMLTVRVSGKETPDGFFMFRDRFSEILLTQEELDILCQIKRYMHAVIRFTEERIGKADGLVFYTAAAHDDLINLLFDLGFIPKEFADKTAYHPGDATAQAVKLFKEKDIKSFIADNFDNVRKIQLEEDEAFIKSAAVCGLL